MLDNIPEPWSFENSPWSAASSVVADVFEENPHLQLMVGG
jgi:hypothetical protein